MLRRIVWTTPVVVLAIACADVSDPTGPAAASSDLSLFATPQASAWEPIASLTNPRDLLGATAGPDGHIYAVGGSSGVTSPTGITSVEVYDRQSNTWTAAPALPAGRHALAVAADLDGRVYAIGGIISGSPTPSVMVLERGATSWAHVAPLANPRQSHAAALGPDGRIYVSGGVNGSNQVIATAEAYDPATNRWVTLAPMSRVRRNHALALGPDGRLYAIAGFTVSSAITPTVEAYDPRTNVWTPVASMPQARQGLAAVLGGDARIYVLGGKDGLATPLATTFVYDARSNAWTAGPSLITARSASAAAALDGRVYAVAGRMQISGNERPWTSVEALLTVLPNAAPTVSAGADATVMEGWAFSRDGSFSDGDSRTWTATVDYGDGSGSQPLALSGASFAISHRYADNGVYTVTVTVTDDQGAAGSDVLLVTVVNVAPSVRAWPEALLIVGETFAGGGAFSDPGADTWSATVDYGDGSGPAALSLQELGFSLGHTYTTSGDFSLVVAVTDDDGGTGTATVPVHVVTPAGGVSLLMEDLLGLAAVLRTRPGNSMPMFVTLQAARHQLERGNAAAATGQLGAFINQVETQVRIGRLAPTQGAPLIDLANRVIAAIS